MGFRLQGRQLFREGWRFFRRLSRVPRENISSQQTGAVKRCRKRFPGMGLCREAELALGLFASVHSQTKVEGRMLMRYFSLSFVTCVSALATLAVGPVYADDDLVKMSQNAADWVMPSLTYDNQRYSTLNQINTGNVGKLQAAWTFSTGVLRGHEG